jgi:hypothetical protein
MNKELAQEIQDRLFPYIRDFADVRHYMGGEQLTVYLKDESSRKVCEELLSDYRGLFSVIHIACHDEASLQYFNQIDFFRFRKAVSRYIQAVINVIKHWEPTDPIYVFVMAIYPGDCQVGYTINTESAWASKLKRNEDACKATGSDFVMPSKYCCAEFTTKYPEPDPNANKELQDYCDSMNDLRSQYYDIANTNSTNDEFSLNFERRFTQMVVQALRENLSELERLPVTNDFVAYVEDYTGGGDGIYTMMETVPLSRLEVLVPDYFPKQEFDNKP